MSPSSPAGSSSSTLPISNTLLALPDGPIPPGHGDRKSYTISYIGGYPSFPDSLDIPNQITCGACNSPIPLLAQVYCPPEGGENDRTVYVWGCSKRKCQRKQGCVRAFRASRRNEAYARDVEEKRAAKEKEEAAARAKAKINPFTMSSGPQSTLFGSAQPLFGAPSPFSSAPASAAPPDLSSLSISTPATTTETPRASSHAPPAPAYQPPQYLSTIGEYIPPLEDMEMEDDDENDEYGPEMDEIKDEKWDKILPKTVDEVFETFARKLQSAEDGEHQVLRYELGGVPLPYASTSPLFRQLFPKAPNMAPKAQGDEEDIDVSPFYDASSIPKCPKCSSARVFEMQLVPSLISTLRPEAMTTDGEVAEKKVKKQLTEEERKEELKKMAKGEVEGDDEMEWGTVMVFGCERDCVGFHEEWVGIEWENPGV